MNIHFSAAEQSQLDKSGVVLLLQVPRTNDKKELAAEQMFASLHGLLASAKNNKLFPARHFRQQLSLEIAVINRRIGFYIWVPQYMKDFVEEQIYAQYPTVQISEVDDYSDRFNDVSSFRSEVATELKFMNNDATNKDFFEF